MVGEREILALRRQLSRLGMTMVQSDPANPFEPCDFGDVLILDLDSVPDEKVVAGHGKRLPVVALVGVETPSRLNCLLDLKPASFLIKPLRSAGLFTALAVAFEHARREQEMMTRIERLEERVRSRRIVFAAILQVMKLHGFDEPDAFAMIRRTAMKQRKTVEQLSAEIVAAGGLPAKAIRIA